MPNSNKVITVSDAAALSEKLRDEGKKIVTTNGAFDLFSLPHLLLLEEASQHGDVLMVGVNSDSSVRQLKGDKRPLVPGEQRMQIVAGVHCVDYVFSFDGSDPIDWLQHIHPQVHVNSAEYTDNCVEATLLKEIGSELILVPRHTDSLSTSDIIEIIQKRYS